jgi:hypothetical protein
MPLALEPNATYRIVLKGDKNKPQEKQPWFEMKYRTARQMRELNTRIDKIRTIGPDNKSLDEIIAVLKEAIVGWGNVFENGVEVPFDIERLEDICTSNELGQLLAHFQFQGFTAEERKN